VIFFDFLQFDWLQQRAIFYDILTVDVVQKSYFLATNRGVKTIFKLKTPPKKFKKSTLSILKTVKYSELASVDLVSSPKCTFLRPNSEKTLINIGKQWPVLHVLIQMFHIYSAILRKYTYKYKYYNVQLVFKHKK
jgi:hypothetical protein